MDCITSTLAEYDNRKTGGDEVKGPFSQASSASECMALR